MGIQEKECVTLALTLALSPGERGSVAYAVHCAQCFIANPILINSTPGGNHFPLSWGERADD
jgi:hypothetical protein